MSVPPQDNPTPAPDSSDTKKVAADRSLAVAPSSQEPHAVIERLNERLEFYESFDALIQDNISHSGRLMREAAARRDEAAEAIRQSRLQLERDREQQRAMLTDLLDDVTAIQRATERLAHRVADTLEQIEFDIDPPGLERASGVRAALGARRSAAEDMREEMDRGVLGHGTGGAFRPSLGSSVTAQDVTPEVNGPTTTPEQTGIAEPDTAANDLPVHHNPETEALSSDAGEPRDLPASDVIHEERPDAIREPRPGQDEEAWNLEERADTRNAEPAAMTDDQPASATDATRPAGAPAASEDAFASSGRADDVIATGIEPVTPAASSGGDSGPRTGEPVPDSAPATDHETIGTPTSRTTNGIVAETNASMSEADRLAAAVGDLSLAGMNLVLTSVPRAAVALAIQRRILSSDDVLRAEVREYYDQRLTLQIISRRLISAEDVVAWDANNAWTVVVDEPDHIELNLDAAS